MLFLIMMIKSYLITYLKGEPIGLEEHENFIDMYLKNFTQQGNF